METRSRTTLRRCVLSAYVGCLASSVNGCAPGRRSADRRLTSPAHPSFPLQVLRENILRSQYWEKSCVDLEQWQDVVDEIYYK